MEHAGDFPTLGEPGCNFQPRLVVLREPHAHGANSAQAEIHVVRPDAQAEQVYGLASGVPTSPGLADTAPSITSEWPPIYFVPAWMDKSNSLSKAL